MLFIGAVSLPPTSLALGGVTFGAFLILHVVALYAAGFAVGGGFVSCLLPIATHLLPIGVQVMPVADT